MAKDNPKMRPKSDADERSVFQKFEDLAKKVVAVPKHAIDKRRQREQRRVF